MWGVVGAIFKLQSFILGIRKNHDGKGAGRVVRGAGKDGSTPLRSKGAEPPSWRSGSDPHIGYHYEIRKEAERFREGRVDRAGAGEGFSDLRQERQ